MSIDVIPPPDRTKIIRILTENPFFASFDDYELDYLYDSSELIKCDSSTPIIREAEVDSFFYVLVLGKAVVRKADRELARLRAGDVFGEMGIVAGTPRTAEVITTTPSLLMKLDGRVLETGKCEFQLKLYKTLCEVLVKRLTRTSNLVETLTAP